jgi:uncharacterized membrane protein YdjX (TVP38/TMEM64 family)
LRRVLPILLLAAAICLSRLSRAEWLSADHIMILLAGHPRAAPAFFAVIYAVFVVLMLSALPLNLAAGFLFGAIWGAVLATVGGSLGCVAALLIARHPLRSALGARVDGAGIAGFRPWLDRRGWLLVAFIRLNPIVPTGPVNYLFGLTTIRLSTYAWSTMLFLFPPALIFAGLGKVAGGLFLTGERGAFLRVVYIGSAALTLGAVLVGFALWLRHTGAPSIADALRDRGSATPTASIEGEARLSKTTLLVLTLNEIEGVRQIMPQIERGWCDQIIIVDGGSTDGTIEWARAQGYEVHVQLRKGIRYAYFEALPKVTGDVVISFSPDGNCAASAIPALKKKIAEGYDLVIGSRYLPGAHSDDDDLLTAFGNWLFTTTVNLLHGARYSDVMVILRAFRKSLVEELDLLDENAYALPERLFGTVISWEPLMSVRAAKHGARVAEVPADEPCRIGGERKLQMWRWGAAYYFQFWRELWFWRRVKPSAKAAAPGMAG